MILSWTINQVIGKKLQKDEPIIQMIIYIYSYSLGFCVELFLLEGGSSCYVNGWHDTSRHSSQFRFLPATLNIMGIYSGSTADNFNLRNIPKSSVQNTGRMKPFTDIVSQLCSSHVPSPSLFLCVTSSKCSVWNFVGNISETGAAVWNFFLFFVFCVLSLVLSSRWNRGTRWTALRSSLTPHPTSWFSWTSCSPEQWCLARCEPPPLPIHSAPSPHHSPTAASYLPTPQAHFDRS